MSAELPLLPEDVAEIVSILDHTPYDRVDIRCSRFSLTIHRSDEGWAQSWNWPEAVPGAATPKAVAAAASPADPAHSEAEVPGLQTVRAQLPGTFYRAPAPGAKPYIDVGSQVAPDTVVGIIETMKLMTPVHARASGTVAEILVENAAVVAAQAALIRVKPAAW